jgi:CBS domain-containing protein
MNAKDVMRRQVAAVRAEDSLARTAALMRDRGCGAVVVVQAAGNRPVAMVTDRDICMAALRTNKPLSDLAVASAMSPALHVAAPDEPVAALASRMGLHQIRRLPVVDAAGALVGIVARSPGRTSICPRPACPRPACPRTACPRTAANGRAHRRGRTRGRAKPGFDPPGPLRTRGGPVSSSPLPFPRAAPCPESVMSPVVAPELVTKSSAVVWPRRTAASAAA